ncbi:MAG TPA: hypothetical protein VGE35_02855 [Candidatus Paceibacterota bacterium]
MTNVQFDESGIARPAAAVERKSKLLRTLESGVASIGVPEQYVSATLVGVLVLICIVSFFIMRGSASSDRAKELTPQEQAQLLQAMPADRPPFE